MHSHQCTTEPPYSDALCNYHTALSSHLVGTHSNVLHILDEPGAELVIDVLQLVLQAVVDRLQVLLVVTQRNQLLHMTEGVIQYVAPLYKTS